MNHILRVDTERFLISNLLLIRQNNNESLPNGDIEEWYDGKEYHQSSLHINQDNKTKLS